MINKYNISEWAYRHLDQIHHHARRVADRLNTSTLASGAMIPIPTNVAKVWARTYLETMQGCSDHFTAVPKLGDPHPYIAGLFLEKIYSSGSILYSRKTQKEIERLGIRDRMVQMVRDIRSDVHHGAVALPKDDFLILADLLINTTKGELNDAD